MRPLGKGRTITTHNTIHNAASRTDTWHQSRQCCPSSPRHRTVKTILIETIVDYNVFGGNYSSRIGLRFYVFSKSKKRDFLRFLKCHVKKNIKNVESVVQGFTFYPRDAMLARVIAIATCLSVRLSVCHAPVLCQNEES